MCIFFCTEEMGEFNKEFAGFYLLNLLCGDWAGAPREASTVTARDTFGGQVREYGRARIWAHRVKKSIEGGLQK